jgi:hypothetical protein
MGTMLFERGISIDRCCEELKLKLSQPETVAGVPCRLSAGGREDHRDKHIRHQRVAARIWA